MDGRTDGRTHRRTENIYSIFRDKLLLLGEHGYPFASTTNTEYFVREYGDNITTQRMTVILWHGYILALSVKLASLATMALTIATLLA